jgi:hydroxymethylglutaryl-CoA lyase
MGYATGINLDGLLRAADLARELTGTAPGGRASAWLRYNPSITSTLSCSET